MWKWDPCACLLVSRSLYWHACFSQSTKKIVLLNFSNDRGIQSGLHLLWMIVNFTNRTVDVTTKAPPHSPLHSEWLTFGLLLDAVAYVHKCEASQYMCRTDDGCSVRSAGLNERTRLFPWWFWSQLSWACPVLSFFLPPYHSCRERIGALIVKMLWDSLINLPPWNSSPSSAHTVCDQTSTDGR